MGVLNLTPDSFSDGGKFKKKNLGYKHAVYLFKSGTNIIDVGGESTRPGSREIKIKIEWNTRREGKEKIKAHQAISYHTTPHHRLSYLHGSVFIKFV